MAEPQFKRSIGGDRLAVLLAVIGFGATAMSAVAPLVDPNLPKWIWKAVFCAGAIVAAYGLVELLHDYCRQMKPIFRIFFIIVIGGISAWWSFYLNKGGPSLPCSVKLDVESLRIALVRERINLKNKTPPVEVYVSPGEGQSCQFAIDLSKAFVLANWKIGKIKEEKLVGSGVYFHAPAGDQNALAIYAELFSSQPLRYDVDTDGSKVWKFWINNLWPPSISSINSR